MGLYNVVKPCVVGKSHHVRPTSAPIEVDDAVAAPLVESGCLEAYPKRAEVRSEGVYTAPTLSVGFVDPAEAEPIDDEPPTDPPPPRRSRGGRRRTEG